MSAQVFQLCTLPLTHEKDVVVSRNRARALAESLKFDKGVPIRIATAVSEIARNAFRYAREGRAEFAVEVFEAGGRPKSQSLVITVTDKGGGITDLDSVLKGTYQSATGMGMGIVGAHRLMDKVTLETSSTGTTVRMEQSLPRGVVFSEAELVKLGAEKRELPAKDELDELAIQNRELIQTFETLHVKSGELEKINEELSETNRGVVALYDELDTIYRLGRVVASKLDLDSLLEAIIAATLELSGAEFASFFEREAEGFVCRTMEGLLAKDFPLQSAVSPATLLAGNASGDVFRVDDVLLETNSELAAFLPGIRSYLAVAVKHSSGEMLGVMIFGHRSPGSFGERTERILESVAVQAAIGIENARLYRNVQVASAAKDQFLAVLSHELRTPLNPIFAILSTMERHPQLPEELKSDVEVMRRNLQLEARLIDDLLDITRIVRGKIPLKEEVVDLHGLIHSVEQTCQEAIAKKAVRLELRLKASSHYVMGDPARLQQVLWNLLNNAVKFTPQNGLITLQTETHERTIVLRCTDTGRGIEPEKLDAIFVAFEQGDVAVAAQFGGLGLGLAISKSLVEAHHGAIRAESQGPHTGSTFIVTLPVTDAVPEAKPGSRDRLPQKGSLPIRILLVDDHEDTRNILVRVLEMFGYSLLAAGSCAEALAVLRENAVDLVISDLGLPDGSGHDLMKAIRDEYAIKGIAMSGYGMSSDIEKSRQAGFSIHLTKPVEMNLLEAAIRKLFVTEG